MIPLPALDPDIESFSPADHKDAERTAKRVDTLLSEIKAGEFGLAKNYAKLGAALLHVRTRKYWVLTHKSFGQYILSIQAKMDKGRTQLYATVAAAERLLPYVSEDQLAEMGISKATALASYVKQSGKQPSPELIEKATSDNVGVDAFRMDCYSAMHSAPPEPGQWLDLGGCYLTPDEKSEWLRACKVAMITDPPISISIPDHMKKKEILLRMAREYLATYEKVVMGVQQ